MIFKKGSVILLFLHIIKPFILFELKKEEILMKRLLLLVLTLSLAVMFAACGTDDTKGSSSSNDQSGALMPDSSNNSSGGSDASDLMPSIPDSSAVNPGTNTPTDSSATDTAINRDRAIEIALNAAKQKKENVYDIDAQLDREQGNLVWEVDFETRDTEFSYEIDADNGNIIKTENEPND